MAIFIVYGVYHHDENERETLYVGTDREEAFKIGVEGFRRLHLEMWISNKRIEKQEYKHHKYGWRKIFNVLDDMQDEITKHLEQAHVKEIELMELKASIHSEGKNI